MIRGGSGEGGSGIAPVLSGALSVERPAMRMAGFAGSVLWEQGHGQ
jgi:hypothetical protein